MVNVTHSVMDLELAGEGGGGRIQGRQPLPFCPKYNSS